MKSAPVIEIIGGGLAGLSLGLALSREKIAVRVVEAGRYPRHRVCGEFITGLEDDTIAQLGIAPLLADAPRHREAVWFVDGAMARKETLPQPAIGISRHALDARLAEAFVGHGGELCLDTRVTSVEGRPGRVLAVGRRRGHSPWLGLKVHVRNLALARDLELHLGDEAYVGLSRVEDGAINVCGLFRRRRIPALGSPPPHDAATNGAKPDSSAPSLDAVQATMWRYLDACGLSSLRARLATAEIDANSFCAVAALEFDARVAPRDEICIGDACAMIPPFTGNGMAMAFQSALIARDPLLRYARGEISWEEACRTANAALRTRFRLRLASADWLHPFLLRPRRQRWFAALR